MSFNINNKIEKIGIIKEILGSTRFRVTLENDNTPESKILAGQDLVCSLCGKMYQRRIKIIKGDKVKLSLMISSEDLKNIKAVIIFRLDH
jgi:translation initiation factor IF-1